jgi:hypothetical protein
VTKTILEQANELIFGDRNKHYGHPRNNFQCIAGMWNNYIVQRRALGFAHLESRDVAMMMVLMKVARDANMPKEDNLIDIAGYAGCAARLDESIEESVGPPSQISKTYHEAKLEGGRNVTQCL